MSPCAAEGDWGAYDLPGRPVAADRQPTMSRSGCESLMRPSGNLSSLRLQRCTIFGLMRPVGIGSSLTAVTAGYINALQSRKARPD